MDCASVVERYLLDTRQIDGMAARQARLVVRAVRERQRADELRTVALLCLAALAKGAPRPNCRFLLQPFDPEILETYRRAWSEENGGAVPPWESLKNGGAVREYVLAAVERLWKNPDDLAPLCGFVPASADEPWPLVVIDPVRRMAGFARYWRAASVLETLIAERLREPLLEVSCEQARAVLRRVFIEQSVLEEPLRFHSRQVAAAALALRTRFLVLSGGPGTGKTSVVLQILRTLMHTVPELDPRQIVLCAPTGRAKARLAESIESGVEKLEKRYASALSDRERGLRHCRRMTIHSLLGFGPDGRPRYDRHSPFPYRVIVVDEASMVDLCNFSSLVEATAPDCRIILCGDMHQLPSVEAGAVLGDLTERFSVLAPQGYPTCRAAVAAWVEEATRGIATGDSPEGCRAESLAFPDSSAEKTAGTLADHAIILTHSYRSAAQILELAQYVNAGDTAAALTVIRTSNQNCVELCDPGQNQTVLRDWFTQHYTASVLDFLTQLREKGLDAVAPDTTAAILHELLTKAVVLTLTHHGVCGRQAINRLGERILRPQLDPGSAGLFFHGQPVIITANHYDLDLYNGDLGIVIRERLGGTKVVVPRIASTPVTVALERLVSVEPAFAMTVHKAQGSEFQRVLLVLPDQPTPLLTRQVLYTAVTRAQRQVRILGREEILERAILTREHRPGGVKVA